MEEDGINNSTEVNESIYWVLVSKIIESGAIILLDLPETHNGDGYSLNRQMHRQTDVAENITDPHDAGGKDVMIRCKFAVNISTS